MGFITGFRRALGLGGTDDGGLGSVVRNVGQIELFGTVVSKGAFEEPPAYEVRLDEDHLPWELGASDTD
ncbi:MAG: hypothetical protein ACTHJL_08425 [Amnibacterium sp.]